MAQTRDYQSDQISLFKVIIVAPILAPTIKIVNYANNRESEAV